jgi:hypothetical protein
MIEERQSQEIEKDIRLARINRVNLSWQPDELAIDMLVTSKQL